MFIWAGTSHLGMLAESLELALADLFRLGLFDLIFVVTAVVFNLQIVGIYIAKKHNQEILVRLFGAITLLQALPLAVVVINDLIRGQESWIMAGYSVIFLYLAFELLADFIYKIDFRSKLALHVPYIILFYLVEISFIAIAFSINTISGYVVSVSFWTLLLCLIYSIWPAGPFILKRGEWQ